ncbi:histidinol dehydrogenase [Agriterribacter sp.]|uniref:histidinol dehydrogenase n=1 Tax=Agriterribacter sp. TaxID=2821509 RepID=UPI002B5AA2F1|nr:histidinol dehydrogenase [Agriterribacter sp.]HTN07333.1 histidinol dehydrogenase [Agriterribacter sp.]
MNIIINPPRNEWPALLQRPTLDHSTLEAAVLEVMGNVRLNGDKALAELTQRFDGVLLKSIKVSEAEIAAAEQVLSPALKAAIAQAKEHIEKFHAAQVQEMERITTMPGVQCWRKSTGIEKVGLYIPGGSAPLFSTVLMLGIPAVLAGCREIVLCTPPGKNGAVHPAVLYAAGVAGITQIYKAGGAQAIAAMAYGTETIPAVYKVFGPGNQYVTCAKQLIQRDGIAIDMPAGPSEVCVLADETANAAYVAADLLSQAEHGPDSQVLLVSTSARVAEQVTVEVNEQLNDLPRKNIAIKALENSKAILIESINEAMALINAYAPEHLIISCANDEAVADLVVNAGSVFLGNYSPESVGDYASGTNHTLPTNGYAKAYSGVSVDSFVKKITYQKLTQQGLQRIASTVICMAEAEGLQAHANAVRKRM